MIVENHRRKNSCDALDEDDSPTCHLSETVFERAADKSVQKVFAILGVDIDKPESVSEFQDDLRFGRRLRKMAEHGSLVVTALLVTGLIWAAFEGMIARISGK